MDRRQKLISILQANDAKEIPFYKTKTSLLRQGYTEAEISHAVYQNSYDGKKDAIKPEDPATKAFGKNPSLAQEVGKQILNDAKKRERDEAIVTGIAARFAPGKHAQATYEFQFVELLGLPYFRLLLGGLLIFILVDVFNAPNWINTLFIIAVSAWIGWAFYTRYMKRR